MPSTVLSTRSKGRFTLTFLALSADDVNTARDIATRVADPSREHRRLRERIAE